METYVVVEYAVHESYVIYAGNNKTRAEEVARENPDDRRIHVWVDGREVRWYDIGKIYFIDDINFDLDVDEENEMLREEFEHTNKIKYLPVSNPLVFGAYGDSVNDDTEALKRMAMRDPINEYAKSQADKLDEVIKEAAEQGYNYLVLIHETKFEDNKATMKLRYYGAMNEDDIPKIPKSEVYDLSKVKEYLREQQKLEDDRK